MTLDIAKLKAAAERAKAAVADYQSGVIDVAEFHRRAAEFHRLTDSPEQTLELIAALEAKDAQISELEHVKAAAEKLVRCKGRYHSEQNYRALAVLFGVKTPDLPPLPGESGINLETGRE